MHARGWLALLPAHPRQKCDDDRQYAELDEDLFAIEVVDLPVPQRGIGENGMHRIQRKQRVGRKVDPLPPTPPHLKPEV